MGVVEIEKDRDNHVGLNFELKNVQILINNYTYKCIIWKMAGSGKRKSES